MFASKRDGIVKFQWQPLAAVELPNSSEVTLKWNTAVLEQARIDKNSVSQEFESAAKGGANIQWSS